MRWLLALALLCTGCLSAWTSGGPWACDAGVCPNGLSCDDGVCCSPGGTPACPTLPFAGACPGGNTPKLYYRDLDGDGAGDEATGRPFCALPVKERWIPDAGDCDDTDPTISPTATERCNGLDDDCDGVIDNGTHLTGWYPDEDGDGYGWDDGGRPLQACAAPKGYVSRAGDCAPSDPSRYPGAPERCNDIDDNCNGVADDPLFIDVENPGSDAGQRFDCLAPGQVGQCAPGGLQCVYDPARNRFAPTCVPRQAPGPELCGDGLDNDCDGFIDNPPGCGGPPSLIAATGTTVIAVRVDAPDAGTPSGLPPGCMAHTASARAMAWLNPSWVGSGGLARHVWALEAPAGLSWDLSGPSTTLELLLRTPNGLVNAAPGGWGDASFFANPVITLCGAAPGQYQRYVPSSSSFQSTVATGAGFALTLPLWTSKAGWQVERGASFDRVHVTGLEVVVSLLPPATDTVTFTLVFAPDGGFHL